MNSSYIQRLQNKQVGRSKSLGDCPNHNTPQTQESQSYIITEAELSYKPIHIRKGDSLTIRLLDDKNSLNFSWRVGYVPRELGYPEGPTSTDSAIPEIDFTWNTKDHPLISSGSVYYVGLQYTDPDYNLDRIVRFDLKILDD